MTIVVPDESEILILQYVLNMVAPGNVQLRLYTNDPTINDSIVKASLTECTTPGYTAVALTGAGWTTTQTGGVTTAVYSAVAFTFTTGATVNGYFITNSGNTKVLFVERFTNAPFSVSSSGGDITINPNITCS